MYAKCNCILLYNSYLQGPVLHKYIAGSEKACGYTFDFYKKHNHVLKYLLEEEQHGEQARFYSRVRLTQQSVSFSIGPRLALAERSCKRARQCSGDANQPKWGHRHRHQPGVSICPWQQIEIWNMLLGRDFCLLLFSSIEGGFFVQSTWALFKPDISAKLYVVVVLKINSLKG